MSRKMILVVRSKMLPKSHCMLKAKKLSFIFLEEAFSNSCGQAPSQSLVTGLPAYDNTTVFVDRADEAYLEKLAEVQNHLCWTNLCFR